MLKIWPLLISTLLLWWNLQLPHLFIFAFVACTLSVNSKKKKSLPRSLSRRFSSIFSARSFMVWGFTFKSLIHFMLIFVYSKIIAQFHSFACWYPVFPTPFITRSVLSIVYSWQLCQKISWPYILEFISDSLFCSIGQCVFFCFVLFNLCHWLPALWCSVGLPAVAPCPNVSVFNASITYRQ